MEKIIAFCFTCGAEHDVTGYRPGAKSVPCHRCKKGYVITPTGKMQYQLSLFGGDDICKSMSRVI